MKKEILFVHSAGPQGYLEGSDFLLTYLQETLGTTYRVVNPKMPDPEHPRYESWKVKLKKELASIHGDVILVGHSLGGSVLLKFLSEVHPKINIAGLFLISAPYWGTDDWEVDEYVLKKSFPSKLPQIPKVFLYHSKDDEVVPIQHLEFYAEKLPHAIIRTFDRSGHLFGRGIPELVNDIKSL